LFDVLMSDSDAVDRLLRSPVVAVKTVHADDRGQVAKVRDVVNRGQNTPIQQAISSSGNPLFPFYEKSAQLVLLHK
jgi:Neuraminidase (sialidase)